MIQHFSRTKSASKKKKKNKTKVKKKNKKTTLETFNCDIADLIHCGIFFFELNKQSSSSIYPLSINSNNEKLPDHIHDRNEF